MKKLLLIAVLLLALALGAAACKGELAGPSDTEETTADRTPADTPAMTDPDHSEETDPPFTTAPEGSDTETPTEIDPGTVTETPTEAPTAEPEATFFTVSFFVSGNVGSQPAPQLVKEGDCATAPSVNRPEDGSGFDGWYTTPASTADTKFDFSTPITDNITLFATITPPETRPGDSPELSQPALVMDPAFLAAGANKQDSNFANEIARAELITEDGRSFLRMTPDHKGVGDPYLTAIPLGWGSALPNYMAISYRNKTPQTGEIFLGSGEGWSGQGDSFRVIWATHGDWSLMVIDLTAVGITSITDGIINYCRLDFFNNLCAKGECFDVEYIAFFHSPEAAQHYDASLRRVPLWHESNEDAVTHHSFDQLYTGTGAASNGPENLFEPGQSNAWNHQVIFEDHTVEYLTYWGWIACKGELGQFGYQINGCTPVFDETFIHSTEEQVMNAVLQMGDTGSRLKIRIPLTGLRGAHTVRTLYKAPDGSIVLLDEFSLYLPGNTSDSTLPKEPAKPTYETWDMLSLSDRNGFATSWKEAMIYVPHIKLGYNMPVYLGEMDLSLYTSVRITYCCDGGETTRSAFETASSHAIGLKSQASSYGQATDDNFNGDLAHTDMAFLAQGWYSGARDAVVDLTEVRYRGDVWLAVHNPVGTEIVILGIEFTRRPDMELPHADLLDLQVVDGQVQDLSDRHFSVTAAGTPTITEALEGPVMSFNRDGAYKVMDIGSLYASLAEGFAMEIYFTTGDDVNRYENLCANMQGGGFGFDYESGIMNFCVKEVGKTEYTCVGAAIEANTTYHAVGVYDKENSRLAIYLNGVEMGSAEVTEELTFASNHDLAVGGDTGEGENPEYLCDADIYFVRLYSSPLDAGTVQNLYDYR